jgi:hypothetical protein
MCQRTSKDLEYAFKSHFSHLKGESLEEAENWENFWHILNFKDLCENRAGFDDKTVDKMPDFMRYYQYVEFASK